MSLEPPLITAVPNLDAPWKIITDEWGYQTLLVREGLPISEHLVNVLNDISRERYYVRLLRQYFQPDIRPQSVPHPREELTGLQLAELKAKFGDYSRAISYQTARYSNRWQGSPQEN